MEVPRPVEVISVIPEKVYDFEVIEAKEQIIVPSENIQHIYQPIVKSIHTEVPIIQETVKIEPVQVRVEVPVVE